MQNEMNQTFSKQLHSVAGSAQKNAWIFLIISFIPEKIRLDTLFILNVSGLVLKGFIAYFTLFHSVFTLTSLLFSGEIVASHR
jgi:hypothetical protein